jgi:hypothetical protein
MLYRLGYQFVPKAFPTPIINKFTFILMQEEIGYARFDVLMRMKIQVTVFWVMMPRPKRSHVL